MAYESIEIRASEKQLEDVFKQLTGIPCLIGGWVVHNIVNKNFEKANGRKYIGSRDIDIGFHIDKQWTDEQIQKSDFASSLTIIENMGFKSVSSRYFKEFDMDSGKELTTEESSMLPMHQILQVFIDPVVDFIHPKIEPLFGFVPIDEPLLSHIFQNKMFTLATLFEKTVLLPKPHVLLAMKLNSAPNRNKEDKRIKDISDIYALLWYSDVALPQLKNQLFSIFNKEIIRKIIQSFTKEDIHKVSSIIGINSLEITRVITELVRN